MIPNESIKKAIETLDSKVRNLKEKHPGHKILQKLSQFYQSVIVVWLEHEMDGKEIDEPYNEAVMNNILDWINIINKILNM